MHTRRFFTATALALALAGLGISSRLEAAAVGLAPVAIGAPLQAALHDRYGAAEGPVLQQAVAQSLSRALKAAGASLEDSATQRIEVTIEQAVATHPTREQLASSPGLDYLRSIARGGARLRAVLRDAHGQVIDHLEYDDYAASLEEASLSGSAWGDALMAFDRFATHLAHTWRHHWVGKD
jgi:hypothetical protein